MPTPTKGPRLGGSPAHERIILDNLASQLFEHRRITTTETKAKRVRPLAEKLITKAKRGDLAARRQVLAHIRDKSVVHQLFTEIAPALAEREGGYTRIIKIGPRKGDNAPMVVIEVITEPVQQAAKTKSGAKSKTQADPATEQSKASAETTSVEEANALAAASATADVGTDADAEATDDAAAKPVGLVDAGASDTGSAGADDAGSAGGERPYGAGSYAGDNPPAGYDIKGNADSMKYHTPESQWYDATVAEAWFNTEEAAQAAGFTKAG